MSNSPYSTPTSPLIQNHVADLVDAAIGTNTDYYIAYLNGSGGNDWAPSWNWPAFFITSVWLLYRKLWLAWLAYVFVLPILAVLLGAVLSVAGETLGVVVQSVILLGCYFVLVPIHANTFYARKLRKLVAKAESIGGDREQRIQWLSRHGGTSWLWILILLPMIGMLAAVALPTYQDYIDTTNMALVNTHHEEGVRLVENQMRTVQLQIELGEETAANFQANWNSAHWAAEMNALVANATSPEGTMPYDIEADDEAGVIGMAATGSVLSDPIKRSSRIWSVN